jgi:D-alanyl-D-alanine carboxypeptidase
MQPALDDWRQRTGTPGAVLGFRLPDGRTAIVASGMENELTGAPVNVGDRFRVGSITKTFVATLILQLASAGLVGLHDQLFDYLPDAPHARRVTIRQLLDHTSGIPDFGDVPGYRLQILTAPARVWTAQQTVDLIADKPLDFKPGTNWAYSNTNYTLLGMVAEQVTGQPLAELLRQHIYEPLGLSDTYLEEEEPGPPMVVVGHYDLNDDGKPDNVGAIPYTALVTSGAAAGGISASAVDVLDFASGLFDGALVDQATLDEMLTVTPPAKDYGLGIERLTDFGAAGWGHGGGIPGFTTVFARGDSGITLVAMANQSDARLATLVSAGAEAIATLP